MKIKKKMIFFTPGDFNLNVLCFNDITNTDVEGTNTVQKLLDEEWIEEI